MWEWDIANNKLNYSAAFMNMIGYEPFEFEHTYDNWKVRVHPDDIDAVEKSLHEYFTNATTQAVNGTLGSSVVLVLS